ncbi:MAG: Rieske 2Fe-2S family protein [Gammaproteobacteria bacterium]|jgi:Rieske 2Fe-2S family protein
MKPTNSSYEISDLTTLKPSLPSRSYYCADVYAAELENIWYRQWVCVCRSDVLVKPGEYRVFQLGTQSIIVVRDKHKALHAFHNTCAHRGSILCENESGQFRANRLTCPYHRWSYDLSGKLIGVPYLETQGSEKHISLYNVALQEYFGNVYINLDANTPFTLSDNADDKLEVLENWPLSDLLTVHTHEYKLACNWKIFWENFVECYHCPGIHPDLCSMIPLYKQSYAWSTEKLAEAGLQHGLATGVESWTSDGKPCGPTFATLTEAELGQGHVFLSLLPTMFIVAHRDYVRQVSIMPLSAEQIGVRTEWLFSEEAIAAPGFDKKTAVDFVMQVLEEDARVCELNQKGLKALAHKQGRLVPQEKDVFLFHQWYRKAMEM